MRIRSVPLVIGQFSEMVDENYGIVISTAGSNYYGTSHVKTWNKNYLMMATNHSAHPEHA